MNKKKIGIIGATGFTGSELVRILVNHPSVEISVITSESRAGEYFSDVHPFFEGIVDQKLVSVDELDQYDLDLVFLALPHGASMEYVKKFWNRSFKIIDLSGDFRLGSSDVYSQWYGTNHVFEEGIREAVFGLPEINREKIMGARLIANPGCYPTSSILGIAPLLHDNLIDPSSIIIDSKSGVTGAGVKSKPVNHFNNVNDNFKAYGISNHRHTIEIQETLQELSQDDVLVQFTPHLLPIDRGILSTIYLKPIKTESVGRLSELYKAYFSKAPFVRVRNRIPSIKDVRGTNYCDIFTTFDDRTQRIIIISVIDNLVKGAAGQAVQNMNLALNMKEGTGLNMVPFSP